MQDSGTRCKLTYCRTYCIITPLHHCDALKRDRKEGRGVGEEGGKDREMIRFGCEESHLRMLIDKNGADYQIDMHLKKARANAYEATKAISWEGMFCRGDIGKAIDEA